MLRIRQEQDLEARLGPPRRSYWSSMKRLEWNNKLVRFRKNESSATPSASTLPVTFEGSDEACTVRVQSSPLTRLSKQLVKGQKTCRCFADVVWLVHIMTISAYQLYMSLWHNAALCISKCVASWVTCGMRIFASQCQTSGKDVACAALFTKAVSIRDDVAKHMPSS